MTNDNVEPHRNTTPTQPAMTMREIRQALGHTTTSPNYITTLDQTRSELRATTAGIHTWQRPADAQVKARMLARRAARVSAENTPLSPEFLARLRELADAATPGPWCTDIWEIYQGTEYQPGISEWIGETCRGRVEGLAQDKADASFVAAAREAVPALLAEVERLRADRDAFCDRVDTLTAVAQSNKRYVQEMFAELQTVRRERSEARARVAELEQQTDAELTVYRASHDSIVMGYYTNRDAARAHCEAVLRREWPNSLLDWIEDEEDGVAELVAESADGETETGYVVTALTVQAAYDEGADE